MAKELTAGTYCIKELAQKLGEHPDTVRNRIRRGEIKACKLGYKTIRVTYEEFERYLKRTEMKGVG